VVDKWWASDERALPKRMWSRTWEEGFAENLRSRGETEEKQSRSVVDPTQSKEAGSGFGRDRTGKWHIRCGVALRFVCTGK